jgi:hypothetical protein
MSLFAPNECTWGEQHKGSFRLNYDNRWEKAQLMRRFIQFTLIWISQNLAIPFWMIGHVHLSLNIYEDIHEILASCGLNIVVAIGFYLDYKKSLTNSLLILYCVGMLKQIPLISGNLLDFPTHCETDPDKYVGINVIAHSCNCQNVMGAGIAKQIKDRYPKAFEADTERWGNEYNEGGNWRCQIGDYSKAVIEDQGTIYNLYTQSGYSTKERQVNYEYFWKALKAMEEDLCASHVQKHEYNPAPPPILDYLTAYLVGLQEATGR